jgi:nicotinamide phosphoribosyltransferase
MSRNFLLNTDSYKASHYLQYPPGTQYLSSYIESRGGDYNHVLFFGLQAFIKEYLLKPITSEDIDQAETLLQAHGLPFNRASWEYIVHAHQGFLPLDIEAVREGAVVPVRNVLLQVVNTDPQSFWLTSYIETALLRAIWYPSTVATISWGVKQVIKRYLDETADNADGLAFKLHDFGARGASSEETAALGGMAHLVNFQGTDTLSGILAAQQYYNESMAGYSIPAAEHSTMTAWGRDQESQAYENMLDQFLSAGRIVAVVSDSYDIWHAIDEIWGRQLKEKIIQSGGTLVIRPDSGDPVDVVCTALEKLMQAFGFTNNSKGYKLLPPYIRLIQGDGLSPAVIEDILHALKEKNISADNLAFGMGGGLLQKCHRDTLRFAMKASAIKRDGQWYDVYKQPVTSPGKVSKRGRLALISSGQSYETITQDTLSSRDNLLQPVYRNGKLLREQTFSDIRAESERCSVS